MPSTKCGFDAVPGGASGQEMLTFYGPTLMVDIGFDPNYPAPDASGIPIPIPGITGVRALVDTGAGESCIDSLLATRLNLPVVDRRPVSGADGSHEANIHLAQIHVPSLNRTITGTFAAVHLVAGGQVHEALIGRTFLQNFTMTYEGKTGTVVISD
jgi:predicted aspartyl protease